MEGTFAMPVMNVVSYVQRGAYTYILTWQNNVSTEFTSIIQNYKMNVVTMNPKIN